MKKTIMLLAFLMIFSLFVPVNASNTNVKIQLNGEVLSLDVAPVMENNRILVPTRGIFEKLGATVTWSGKTSTVSIENNSMIIEITIGKNYAKIYRKHDLTGTPEMVKLDIPAKIVKGRTIVPLRFIAETLNAKVDWHSDHLTVTILTPDFKPQPALMLDKPIGYTVVEMDSINSNKELMNWINEHSHTEGIHSIKLNSTRYILVAAGMKPSGGYSVSVDGVYDLGEKKIFVEAILTTPKPDEMVITALTFPTQLIRIDGDYEVTNLDVKILERK